MQRRASVTRREATRAPATAPGVAIVDAAGVDAVRAAIARRTGLRFATPADESRLTAFVSERIRARQLTGAAEYLALIERGGAAAREEWVEAARALTVGESYFFRDSRQIALLRARLLPDAIARRRHERRLRVWSAGCSSGEEAFSLAILAQEALADAHGWKVTVVGTDLNPDAVARARAARYGAWSFRHVNPARHASALVQDGDAWRVRDGIRRLVTFHEGNLVDDVVPDRARGLADFDIILCRNVLLYLEPDAVRRVARKFFDALAPGGYLLTGHGDLPLEARGSLETVEFPESVAYRRPERATAPRAPARAPAARAEPARAPLTAHDLDLAARAAADRGDHEEARALASRATRMNPFRASTYFLLAQLAEERDDPDEARRVLRKVLYLAPESPGACLELAALEERAGDEERAARLRRTAIAFLARVPANSTVEPYEGVTARDLLADLTVREGRASGEAAGEG